MVKAYKIGVPELSVMKIMPCQNTGHSLLSKLLPQINNLIMELEIDHLFTLLNIASGLRAPLNKASFEKLQSKGLVERNASSFLVITGKGKTVMAAMRISANLITERKGSVFMTTEQVNEMLLDYRGLILTNSNAIPVDDDEPDIECEVGRKETSEWFEKYKKENILRLQPKKPQFPPDRIG